jgi:hypothetical protein
LHCVSNPTAFLWTLGVLSWPTSPMRKIKLNAGISCSNMAVLLLDMAQRELAMRGGHVVLMTICFSGITYLSSMQSAHGVDMLGSDDHAR